jgi:hypothetical protein
MYTDSRNLDRSIRNISTWFLQLVTASPFTIIGDGEIVGPSSIIFHTWNDGLSAVYIDVN